MVFSIIPPGSLWWLYALLLIGAVTTSLLYPLALAYSASAFVAVELGEKDEDKVEKVVSERMIEEHEEAGEMIVWIAGTLSSSSSSPFSS